MSFITKLFSSEAKNLASTVGGVIDGLNTTDDEKSTAKSKLSNIVFDAFSHLQAMQRDIITTEMRGNFLQRSWRPALMLSFGVILFCRWFGWADPNIPEALELELMSIIKLGLGGYVIGRSTEQVAKTVTANIDMPFLKKKDRKID